MSRVIIIGGGWAGCAAAVASAQKGCQVTLVEKTDRLLGYGLVAGEIYQNARLTISLETAAMGGRELFKVIEGVTRHKNVPVPGAEHTTIYDVLLIETQIEILLKNLGVEVLKENRAVNVQRQANYLEAIILENHHRLEGEAFVDCSGSAGPVMLCRRHGWGCVACISRCPVFGGRVSMVAKMGIEEKAAKRPDGRLGATGRGLNILKASLDPGIVREIEDKGFMLISLPPDTAKRRTGRHSTDQHVTPENLFLVDNGFIKIKSCPFLPLDRLRTTPGFERAVLFDPAGGGRGNCIRFLATAPRDRTMRVKGTENLFVAGEKQGLLSPDHRSSGPGYPLCNS